MPKHDRIVVREMEDGLRHWVADLTSQDRSVRPHDLRYKWVKRCVGTVHSTYILYLRVNDGVPNCLRCSLLGDV